MKHTLSTLISAVCWSCRLAAASTHVYTIETEAPAQDRLRNTELSPEVARSVLAQRTGVEDYHSINLEKGINLWAINTYGARQSLFDEHKAEDVLILVEGVDDEPSFLDQSASFIVSPSPSANATRGLFLDLTRQALPLQLANQGDDALYTLLKDGLNQKEQSSAPRIGIWSEQELESYIEDTLTSQSKGIRSITIITTSSSDKGEKSADYGTYTMPHTAAQHPLRKRQQSMPETPLEIEPTPKPSTAPVSPAMVADQSTPLRGILPACFPSLALCQSTTRNCSGHGACSKKYTDPDAQSSSKFKDCYACACSATTKDSGNGGVSTTYWGGPACQKKDVSVQFWLIALFSVFMVGLVSFAVGQVYSMGSEELPSVIGAGVSGPVKRS